MAEPHAISVNLANSGPEDLAKFAIDPAQIGLIAHDQTDTSHMAAARDFKYRGTAVIPHPDGTEKFVDANVFYVGRDYGAGSPTLILVGNCEPSVPSTGLLAVIASVAGA